MTISTEALLIAIRRKLIGTSAVVALVKDRVHTAHFYDFDNGTIPMPCVIIELVGGSSNYAGSNQSSTLYIYSYSRESSAEASAVYDALYLALNAQKVSGNTLNGYAHETARPISGYNPVARSYFYRGSYQVLTAG